MNKDETILEIMKDYPTQKIGLDDFYGRQTVINMMNKAINFTHCCTQLPSKEELKIELENHQNKVAESHHRITIDAYGLGFRHCYHYIRDYLKGIR